MANRFPERPVPSNLPAERTLTQEQFEMVIRRAAELQARAAEDPAGGGLTEAEAIRIGREIGISPQHLRRALAETGTTEVQAPGMATRVLGPAWVHASRTVPGGAAEVQDEINQYLVGRERLAPIRRFPDRTTYGKSRENEFVRMIQMTQEALQSRKRQPPVGAGFLGAPLLPGAMWGTKMAQVKQAVHAQTHLESILDCLERGEPLVARR